MKGGWKFRGGWLEDAGREIQLVGLQLGVENVTPDGDEGDEGLLLLVVVVVFVVKSCGWEWGMWNYLSLKTRFFFVVFIYIFLKIYLLLHLLE